MSAAASTAASTESARVDPALTELLRTFQNQGYVVIPGVVPRARLAELSRALVDELETRRRSGKLFEGGGLVAGHINCFPGEGARFVYDSLVASGVVDLIRAIAPAAASAPRIGCNLNFPNSVAQNWHIDGAFADEFFVVNVTAVDTTVHNGAIDLLPASHHVARPFWRMALGGFRGNRRVESRQGDVLVRSSRLWHRGMPNRSAEIRPMLGITFGEDSAPAGDPFSTNDGAIGFYPNRFRTDRIGQLRERTYVRVPAAHGAIRLVRSLLGKDGYA